MVKAAAISVLLTKVRRLIYGIATSAADSILWYLSVPPSGCKISTGKEKGKIIMYAGEFLPPRIARLAKWCKKSGRFTTILLCHRHGYVQKFSNREIDHTFLFRNKWHLKRLIKALPAPYIMHNFAPKSKYPFIALETLKKINPAMPVLTDYQDVLVLYYGLETKLRWLNKELPYEKQCFQRSDGIVAQSLEPFEGMRKWNITDKKKRIFFPLYADNDSFCNNTKVLSADDIHLVYAGGVAGSHRDKSHYGATQFHWLIDTLTAQKIHFHIYPSPSGLRADYMEYEQLAAGNNYFHFHPPVEQDNLAKELSAYHYGLLPFFTGASNQSGLKYRYATTLKLFNYLEAGIPIIAGADVLYQSWLVERYKLGMVFKSKDDFNALRKQTGAIPYAGQVKNVLESREHLSLKKHIPRLLEFYKSFGGPD